MRVLRRILPATFCIVGIAVIVAACQTAGPQKLSVDEAMQIAISVESVEYKAPPRAIDDLRDLFAALPEVPNDCDDIREDRRFDIQRLVGRLPTSSVKYTWTQSLLVRSGAEFTRGNLHNTLDLLDAAIASTVGETTGFYGVPLNGNLYVQKTIVLASIRDTEAAQENLARAQSVFGQSRQNEYSNTWIELLMALGNAAVYHARNELATAEDYYRRAARLGEGVIIRYNYFYPNRLLSDLSRNLMQQGRLDESELVARTAVKRALTDHNPQIRYTAQTAQQVVQFAHTLLEQGRLHDAEFIARSAVRLHEIDCSLANSLGSVRAQQVLASVLAAKGDWQGVRDHIQAVRIALDQQPEEFERLFGDNVDWALALIYGGRELDGVKRLEAALAKAVAGRGRQSYEAAEITGLLGMASVAIDDHQRALTTFRAALPGLVNGRDRLAATSGDTVRSQRAQQIIDAYLDLLGRLPGAPRAEELLRVASIAEVSSVQRALAAAAARTTPEDPVLANLVRQEQDAAMEMNSLIGTLSYFQAASQADIGLLSMGKLRERIAQLSAARTTLAQEIRVGFPQFAQLMAPRPTTVADVRGYLRAGEVLLATYTTADQTFVWAIPSQGAIGFAVVALGSQSLERIVTKLRKALDPEIDTLGDIPEFDLQTGYELYASLFKKIEQTWRDAKQLIYVPQGVLATLPITLLPTKFPSSLDSQGALFEGYREVPWLARQHAVSVFPSLASFRIHRANVAAARAPRPFAGFGDPVFGGDQADGLVGGQSRANIATATTRLAVTRSIPVAVRAKPKTRTNSSATLAELPSLPDTRDEIQEMGRVMGADPQRDIFLGHSANEKRVKAMSKNGELALYQVIAFATHALVPGDLDGLLEPALALSVPQARESEYDGLLGVGEILELKLRAEWVVLSACNTAAAQGAGAEAVSGLGRAFFYAGARSLLVTNWPVETRSAKELTTSVFKLQVDTPDLSRAEALQRAMIGLIDHGGYRDEQGRMVFSYAHPIFWAPFTLVGDSGGKPPDT